MNNAEGSGVSNVRRVDAAAYAAASVLALTLFLLPRICAASSSELIWGDVVTDTSGNTISDNQIFIQDGGTYPVSLHTSGSIAVFNQAFLALYGTLYLLSDSTSTVRTQIGTFGSGSSHTLAWNQAGRYELDIYKSASGPILGESLWDRIHDLFTPSVAYAQTNANFVQSIYFTITDITNQNTNPPVPNILFIPGIESSRLYTSSGSTESQLWEPGFFSNQADVKALYLDQNGASINPVYTKAGAAITISADNIYKTFLQQLAGLKASSTIADYLVFPYDWRKSPDDIVSNGTQYDDGTHYLDQALIALAATSRTGKVTIVGHSNGGLVAKALMLKLQSEGRANLVDKVILVDVPQTGTPKAIASMLHGDFQDMPESKGFMASLAVARGLGENMPDAYDLLPSAAYFAKVATPVIDLSKAPALQSTAGISGTTIAGTSSLANFVTGVGGRKKPAVLDVETPDVLSPTMLANAASLHADLDSWQPPAGVQVIQIAGWGLDTPSEVTYSEVPIAQCQNGACSIVPAIRHVVNMTEDGDGTVVIPSEVATTGWPTYYINLNKFNDDTHAKFNHADITETQPFQDLFNLLMASSSPKLIPPYVVLTQPSAVSATKSLRLRALSPVSLDAYDSLGNHTGMAVNPNPQSDDQYVEEQIPESYYEQYGEGQYIGLPADGNYTVKLHGTDTGTFTFEVTPVSGGVAGAPVTFADIPVTASTTATINLSSDTPTSTSLALDVNGDGIVDATIASSTQTTNPLAYAKLVQSSIALMDIGAPVQKQLQAKFTNTIYLLTKIDQWDTDDADAKDTNKADKASVRVLRKLNRTETYIQNEIGKPISKRDKDERITQAQAGAIIDMIEQLKGLVNSNQI